MSGAIPPLLQYAFMAWCLVKRRDNFTFAFTFTTTWRVLMLRMEETPPIMEGSCEHTEQIAAESRQGVVLQLGDCVRG
jgi:hypothetical protein